MPPSSPWSWPWPWPCSCPPGPCCPYGATPHPTTVTVWETCGRSRYSAYTPPARHARWAGLPHARGGLQVAWTRVVTKCCARSFRAFLPLDWVTLWPMCGETHSRSGAGGFLGWGSGSNANPYAASKARIPPPPTLVRLHAFGGGDAAADGAARVDLRLHLEPALWVLGGMGQSEHEYRHSQRACALARAGVQLRRLFRQLRNYGTAAGARSAR